MDPALLFPWVVLGVTAACAVLLHWLTARRFLASACAAAIGIAVAWITVHRGGLTGHDVVYGASAFMIAFGVSIPFRRRTVPVGTPLAPGIYGWKWAAELFARPQPVTFPMVALFALIPFYIVIGHSIPGRTVHVPEVFLDRLIPLGPEWAPIYGSLFLLVILPAFVVHQQEHVRRTIYAYLMVWLVGYVFFLAYPTLTPRPPQLADEGFFAWMLRAIYSTDVEYNCFPSLHVAQSFLSALTCYRVHRGVGIGAGIWATLVSLSTLFTKQHYVLDVLAGACLAYAAHATFVRGFAREAVPELDRRMAPLLAAGAVAVYGAIMAGFAVAYALTRTAN
jgi:membrane-associated phospholipid phosphatase